MRDFNPSLNREMEPAAYSGCGCPVDTSAAGRSTDRADRRDSGDIGQRLYFQTYCLVYISAYGLGDFTAAMTVGNFNYKRLGAVEL